MHIKDLRKYLKQMRTLGIIPTNTKLNQGEVTLRAIYDTYTGKKDLKQGVEDLQKS